MDDDVRDLMRRATSQVEEIDLVPGALSGARTRQRRRVAVRIGGLAAAAVTVTALVLTLGGPDDPAGRQMDPAGVTGDPSQPSAPQTEPEVPTETPAPGIDLPDLLDPQVHSTAESIADLMTRETWIEDAACQAKVLRTEGETSWAWMRCTGEPSGGTHDQAPGQSVPVRFDGVTLDVPDEPLGSSSYEDDVRALFPEDLADLILEHDETPLLPDVVTAEELRTARLLIETADHPTIDVSVLPLAPRCVSRWVPRIATLPSSQLGDPSNWRLDHPEGHFRGRVGPFSALDLLIPRPGWTPTEGSFVISAGPHTHCVSRAVPPPQGTEGLRQVSIRPAPGALDSCLAWSTVDLYLDDGLIQVVSLDLYEP